MKTRKGSLNHKNDEKEKEKEIEVELKTQKVWLDCKKGVLGLKTRKSEQRMEVFYAKLRQFMGKQSLTYARKGLKTSAKRIFRDRTYSLLAWNISSVHFAVFLSPFCTHTLL